MEIGKIVKGHANELLGLNKDISKERIEICKNCPIYDPHWGGICNSSLWLNPKTNEVARTPKDGYVQGCGCRIPAKTTLPNAECVAGKW